MKMINKILCFLVVLVLGFSDVSLSQEDPCAAYVSQSGIARCKDRVLKVERMNQAKENRQERENHFKGRFKSKSAVEDVAAEAKAKGSAETAVVDKAVEGMTDEEVQKAVSDLREKLKALEGNTSVKSQDAAENTEKPVNTPEITVDEK